MSYSAHSPQGTDFGGRFDLPPTGSDLKTRDQKNQLPGRIGTMRGWLIDQVKALRGLDFTDKKKDEPKKEEPKKEEAKKDEPKKEEAKK